MGCCSSAENFDVPPTHSQGPADLSKYDGAGPWASTDKNYVGAIRMCDNKAGAAAVAPRTLHDLFKQAVDKCGDKPCLHIEDPCPAFGDKAKEMIPKEEWKPMTYAQYYANCRHIAAKFIDFGLQPLDAVNVYGFNSPEWFMASYAATFAGGVTAGIYPSDTPEQVMFKSKQSGAAIAVVQGIKQAEIFGKVVDQLPKLKAIIQWSETDKIPAGGFKRKDGSVVQHVSFADVMNGKNTATAADVDARIAAQKPGGVCTYIYTSGTTGNPKAVMISHDNIIFEAATVMGMLNKYANVGSEPERIISYLPLSHVAGMMVDIICPIVVAAEAGQPCGVYFARAYDLKKGTIGNRLRAVKPTMFLGVPRVWEKIMAKIKLAARNAPAEGCLKSCIKAKGLEAGLQHQRNCQLGAGGAKPCCMCAANIVSKAVRAKLGLEECKFGFTGAAPITVETLEFFGKLGLQINEVYGMSECTGATTFSVDQAHLWGSCGFQMPGTEVKVFQVDGSGKVVKECPRAPDIFFPKLAAAKAAAAAGKPGADAALAAATKEYDQYQGEICFRGRHIMTGYMANPDLGDGHVKTIKGKLDKAIDKNGWLHSGDKGCMGVNGMLKITGRYKELIIGAGGENVAPVPIESAVKRDCPAISNIMMVGDQKPFMAAFVTLKAKGATGTDAGGDDLDGEALDLEKGVTTISGAMKSDAFKKRLFDLVSASSTGAAPSNAARIRKICILPRDFSITTGELGPTLKLKRSVAQSMNANAFEAFYSADNKKVNVVDFVPTGGAAAGNATAVESKQADAPAVAAQAAAPVDSAAS